MIKLKEPNSTVLAQLGAIFPGVFFIVPKEAENPAVLDLKAVGAGSGPFYLSTFNSTANRTYKRNPGFKKDKRNVPYMDEVSTQTSRSTPRSLLNSKPATSTTPSSTSGPKTCFPPRRTCRSWT